MLLLTKYFSNSKGDDTIFNNKVIKNLIVINLAFLAIILFTKMFFIHRFIKIIFKSFLAPLLISVFLFYIIKPLNNVFIKKNLNPSIAALLTLSISVFVISGISFHFSKYLINQFNGVTEQLNNIVQSVNSSNSILNKINKYIDINGIYIKLTDTARNYIQNISNSFLLVIHYIIDTFSKIFLIVVILFYLLKDGSKFKEKVLCTVPHKYKSILDSILSESDEVLNSYVTGQFKVALSLSIMIFIGYKIIGLPNALFLSSITFILAFIPFVGFIISMTFPFIIALNLGLNMVLKLAITFIIVQTLKGRIVVPAIMASAMKIHPLTDIFLVIGAAALGGAIAAFSIVPIYAIIKVILLNLHKFLSKTNYPLH